MTVVVGASAIERDGPGEVCGAAGRGGRGDRRNSAIEDPSDDILHFYDDCALRS